MILILLTLLAYLPAWPGCFVWDDDVNLLENPRIWQADGLGKIWFSSESLEYYPVFYTSLRLQSQLFGKAAFGYLGVNLVLHIANALLFWAILRRLNIRGAYWAALFFSLHPAAVHAVGWISQHKTILSASFYLASMLLFMQSYPLRRDVKTGAGVSLSWRLMFSFGLFVLGLLAKPTLVFLPVFLFFLGRLVFAQPARRIALVLVPWVVIAGLAGVARMMWIPPPDYDLVLLRSGDGWVRWAVAGWSAWFSFAKTIFPYPLMMIYPRWPIESWTLWHLTPLSLWVLLLFILWRFRNHATSAWLGFLFFTLAMIPVSGLFDNTYFAFAHVANHWLYPALPGLIPLMTAGLIVTGERYPSLKGLACPWVPGVIASIFFICTAWESYRFHDRTYYYQRAALENPDNIIAHHNLANIHLESGDKGASLHHYLEAIRIQPRLWPAHIGAGKLLAEQGNLKEAFDHFSAAYDIFPDNPETHFHLGVLYGQAGSVEDAIQHFQASVALNDSDPVAWNNLGIALFQAGRWDEAITAFERSLVLNPNYDDAMRNLNHARQKAGSQE